MASGATKLRFFTTLAAVVAVSAFRPGVEFAIFGNSETKALIRAWTPKPVDVPSGSVMLPSGTENMKKFVRARILLEQADTGSIATMIDGSLSVIICKFGTPEHLMLLPLWQPNTPSTKAFKELREWHKDRLGHKTLSGAMLEDIDDRKAWAEATM
eukprot:6182537-Pleurochrysis_carterae.AAC.1